MAGYTKHYSHSSRSLPAVPPVRTRDRYYEYDHKLKRHMRLSHIVIASLLILGAYTFALHRPNVLGRTFQPVHSTVSSEQLSVLDKNVNNILDQYADDSVSVYATDLQTGQAVHYGTTDAFTAASTAKLLSAVYFLHLTETGQESLHENLDGDPAEDLLQQMVVNSDDNSWEAINNELTHPALLSYATQIGFTNYDPDQNTLPASDIQTLLTRLYKGELLNSADTQRLLGYMQQANYRTYIVAATPSTDTVYHKVGLVDGDTHDAAIVKQGGHAIALTIFTDGDDDDATRTQLIQAVTKQIETTFFSTATSSAKNA